MKKTKKLLALIMAVALTAGLFAFGGPAAVAADYSDADSIANNEAVDVLSALRVVEGTNGAYRPADNVTRAEAAAILARLVAGRGAADSLPAAATGFVDVPASHWASKYIAYCVAQGYVAGYGNRRFGPNDNVTSAQFAAMLLRAVGYGKLGEFEGALWETNAIVLGMREKILEGDKNFSAPATRDDTAQYAFKALSEVHMVDLSTDRTNYVPRVRRAPDPYAVGQFIDAPVAIMDNIYPQLEAQRSTPGYTHVTYGSVSPVTVADIYGRPSTRWIYAGVEIGLYPFKPIATFTTRLGPTEEARRVAVLNAVGTGYAFSTDIKVYLNGNEDADSMYESNTPPGRPITEEIGGTWDPPLRYNGLSTGGANGYADIKTTSRNDIGNAIGNMTQNGLLIELFISYPNTSYARIDVVTATQTDIYKVIAVNTSARQVTLEAVAPAAIKVDRLSTVIIKASDNEDLYDVVKDCKVDAFVLLTMGFDNEYIPADIYLPESVTGVMRSNTVAGGRVNSVTLTTSERYNLAYRNGAMGDLSLPVTGKTEPPKNGTDESILYFDKFGYLVGTEAAAPPPTDFLYVIGNVTVMGSNGVGYPGVRAILANGEEIYVRAAGDTDPGLKTYTINGGVYSLSDNATTLDTAFYPPLSTTPGLLGTTGGTATERKVVDLEGGTIAAGNLRLIGAAQSTAGTTYSNLYANNVKFIYIDTTNTPTRFSVREGVQKVDVPLITGSYAVIERRGTQWLVTAVFMMNSIPTATDPNAIMYVRGQDTEITGSISADGITYRSYSVVLPGTDAVTNIYLDGTGVPPGFYTYNVRTVDGVDLYNVFRHAATTGNTSTIVVASITSMQPANVLTAYGNDPAALVPNPITNYDFNIDDAVVIDARPGPQTEALPIGNNANQLRSVFLAGGWTINVSILYNDTTSKASVVYIHETK